MQHGSTNLTETNRSSFPVGTVLEYRCDSGYVPDGPNILTCSAMGHWSSEPPRCIRTDGKDNVSASLQAKEKLLCTIFFLHVYDCKCNQFGHLLVQFFFYLYNFPHCR